MPTPLNTTAQKLKRLHKPGTPLLLANTHDAYTATSIASLPSCLALATASKAIALAAGLSDDDLDLETNLRAIKAIGLVAKNAGKPLTCDLQDGYGEELERAISAAIEAGAVGCNIEDVEKDTGRLMGVDEAVGRVERVLAEAEKRGVPDFVVNARTDVLVKGLSIEEAIERGKRYLAAGATTAFVWGGLKRTRDDGEVGGVSRSEVKRLVEGLGGMLNVSMLLPHGTGLTAKELGEIGVARVSVGPRLQAVATEAARKEAEKFLG